MSPLQRQILESFATHPQSPPEDQEHHVRQVRDDLLPQLQPEEALGDSAHRQQADGGPAFCLSNFGTPSRYGKPSCKNFFYRKVQTFYRLQGFSQHYQYEAYSYAQQQYNHYHQHSHYYQHHNPAYYPRQWW